MKQFGVWLLLAVIFLSGCQTTQEIAKAKSKEEARVDVRLRWAKEHIQNAQFEEAKRPLTQALDIDSKNPKVLNLLAFVFQQQGELGVAESYYQQMLRADPKFAAGQNNYGIFLMFQDRYEEACDYLQLASGNPLYEGRPLALENLASCYLATDQQVEAEKAYRQVLRLLPGSTISMVALANMAFERGDSAEAWALFNQFSDMVNRKQENHSPQSLWLGVRLSRENRDVGMAATYALLLKNIYPQSQEYKDYKESRR